MDNVSHTLCALALNRAGIDRMGPWLSGTLVVACNLPDLDGLVLISGGQSDYLCHHRGISHALAGLAVEGVLLGLAVCWLARWRGTAVRAMTAIWVSWVGLLSHLGMDALNSYGVRPWLPFDDRWVYLDVAFVADPWIWAILTAAAALGGPRGWRKAGGWVAVASVGAALLLWTGRAPALAGAFWSACMIAVLGLRARGIGLGRSRGIARAGLILLGVYLVLLSAGSRAAHDRAMSELEDQIEGPIQSTSTHAQPAVPWRFRVVVQTPERLYRAMVDLRLGTVDGVTTLSRGLDNPRLEKARDTDEYRVWQGFARHRFAGTFEGQLVLGDGRYSWSPEPSWCNLLVPVDNGPTGSK